MDKVVKVDGKLFKKIEEFIKKNKFVYSSRKQIVNLAIIEFLNSKSFENKEKKRKNGRNEY